MISPLFKLALAGLAGYVGYRVYETKMAAGASYPITLGQTYQVSLQVKPALGVVLDVPTQQTVQNILNANAPGEYEVINAPTFDATNNIVTFLLVGLPGAPNAVSASVLSSGWSAMYASVTVLSVQASGSVPAPSPAASATASAAPASVVGVGMTPTS
jgi:hypothetical protein